MRNCGKCHKCGNELRKVMGGEEWCDTCLQYRRYKSHGWKRGDEGDCPTYEELALKPTRTYWFMCENAEGWCHAHYNCDRWKMTLDTLREAQGVETCDRCGHEAALLPPDDELVWCPDCKGLVEPEGRLDATGIHGDCPCCGIELEP